SPSSRSDGIFACISLALPTARPGRAIRRNGSWRGTPIIHGGKRKGKALLPSQGGCGRGAAALRHVVCIAPHRHGRATRPCVNLEAFPPHSARSASCTTAPRTLPHEPNFPSPGTCVVA